MTVRAVDLARIVRGIEEPYEVERWICHVAWCVESVSHAHHVMARGPMGGAYDWLELTDGFTIGNLVGLCAQHHNDTHSHKAAIRLVGRAWEFDGDGCKGLLNPRAPVRTLTEGEPAAHAGMETVTKRQPVPVDASPAPLTAWCAEEKASSPSVSVPPGADCPQCKRRVPHPRKKTSPKSKTFGFRVPLDEVDEFAELLDAAAAHWGVKHVAHHRYRLMLDALVLVLQTESKEAA